MAHRMEHIRQAILDIARRHIDEGETDWQRLIELVEGTKRRQPIRKAPAREEPKVTRSQVAAYFRWHPDANNMDAARHFGVNSRAISEAYRGRRYG